MNSATSLQFKPKDKDAEKETEKSGLDILYMDVVGSLLWLSNGTRKDISFTVNQIATYCCDRRIPHRNACKRLVRYLPEISI